jgi:hypothetical protein
MTGSDDGNRPSHPQLQAALLMVGVVLLLVVIAVLEVM